MNGREFVYVLIAAAIIVWALLWMANYPQSKTTTATEIFIGK